MRRKAFIVMTAALLSIGCLTGCNSESREAKIAAAAEAGKAEAEAMFSAEKVEVTEGADTNRNLASKVGEDAKSFQRADASVKADQATAASEDGVNNIITFVIDLRTGLFHRPDCEEVPKITTVNRQNFYGTKDDAIAQTYQPCTICKP